MRISNFEDSGLIKVENWINLNTSKDIDTKALKEILSTINVSFAAEEINRLQSTLICELKDSYVQQSQRYVAMGDEAYTLPKLQDGDVNRAREIMDKIFRFYRKMSELKEGEFKGRPRVDNYKYGIPIEDARYILPLSTKTNLVCAMSGDKLFELYKLITDIRYSDIFKEFKKTLDQFIPSKILKMLVSGDNNNAEKLVQSYFINELEKITEENNIILLHSFKNLDLKVGLGALTSTQSRTPSETLDLWQDKAEEKASGVASRVLGYGHESISELARTTFGMMCSLVTYHQQIRHRLSKNYREPLENLIVDRGRLVVVPNTIKNSVFYNEFINLIEEVKEFRMYIYKKYGVNEALYFLLNADQIKIVTSSNARIDCNVLMERTCINAQWEIRELSIKKLMILREMSSTLYEKALPSCVLGKCKEGKLTCGKQQEVKERFFSMKNS